MFDRFAMVPCTAEVIEAVDGQAKKADSQRRVVVAASEIHEDKGQNCPQEI